jgi:cholesterol oxidase
VIGSGFGGAVAALRLAQAGELVTVLERGFRWPRDPWRGIFASELMVDGRALWFRQQLAEGGLLRALDLDGPFGGVLDQTDFDTMQVLRGACVGGGSVVFTGVMIQPRQRYFDALFGGRVSYDDMHRTHFPKVRAMLRLSALPDDLYQSAPFGHSRVWDAQARRAGYTPQPVESIFNWSVVRDELRGRSRPSSTAGLSNFGNSNGAKFDLNQNYLPQAEATGRVSLHPGHVVHAIGREGGRYVVELDVIAPDGEVTERRVLTADRLYLAAGSVGTSQLLVKARALGTLAQLNEHVGEGWGTNGDAVTTRSGSAVMGLAAQAAPCASMIHDDQGDMPVTLENWYLPLAPLDMGVTRSLAMTFDREHRGRFRFDAVRGQTVLDWAPAGNAVALAEAQRVNQRICEATGTRPGWGQVLAPVTGSDWTAHPLGGAVLGRATDTFGRVQGHAGLYVLDGALVPGNAGAVNPSLTIAALAERNIAEVIRQGG